MTLISHRVIFKINTLHSAYKNILTTQNVHNRNLRNNLNLVVSAESYRPLNKVLEKASIDWNDLTQEIKNSKNRDTFKSKVENHIIRNY